jgi:hypothetical protein
MKKPADKKSISRNELLKIINDLEGVVGIESYSRILDFKENLGFDRDENLNVPYSLKK